MSNEETFEDIVKSKLSEKEFSFDEENWEKAEEMIAFFRKKEKIKKGAFIFFSGLLLGIIIMFPFINRTKNTNPELITQNAERAVKPNNIDNKQYQAHAKSPVDLESTEKEEMKDNGRISSAPNVTSSQIKEHVSQEQHTSTIQSFTKKGRNKTKFQGSSSRERLIGVAAEPVLDKITSEESIEKEEIAIDTKVKNDLTILKDSVAKTDSVKVVLVAAADSIVKDSVALVKKDSSVKLNADNEKANLAFAKPWQISVFVGGNYLMGGTLNPFQGFEFIKPIDSAWSIGTGLDYTYLNIKASNAVKTIVTNTTYDFGYTSEVVQIKTNDLHYIVVPVFVQRKLNEKNSILLGANNYMLLTVSNNYSTYKESYGNKQNESSSKTFGYSSGFNPYDIGLLLGYKRKLFNNISLSLYMNYGLMNIKKKGYYTDNTFDRNVSGQLMLTYRLR